MNKNGCIHPNILSALAACGHGDRILIADGNYPIKSRCPHAQLEYLGVRAGLPTVTDVLLSLLHEINVESATAMMPDSDDEPPIFEEFRKQLGKTELKKIGRFPFYEEAANTDVRLVISTGDERVYANILLTVGVA